MLFSGIFLLGYAAALVLFPLVRVSDTNLMKIATRNPVTPGGFGYALQRYQEADRHDPVDVVFLGSSHAYRTYNPAVWQVRGFSAFNLGSTGQTPLNSYYVLKRYLPTLKPSLVVVDLTYRVIDRDGLESFYDLASNLDWSREVAEMAFDIGSPHAINAALAGGVHDLLGFIETHDQRPQEGKRYGPNGFVAFTTADSTQEETYARWMKQPPRPVDPHPDQMGILDDIVTLCAAHGARVVFVAKPEPEGVPEMVANYAEVTGRFAAIAETNGAGYYDFNDAGLPLVFPDHFHDVEYLNSAGSDLFNAALVDTLVREGWLAGNR